MTFDPAALAEEDHDDPAHAEWRGKKERYMKRVLGPPADVVGHSLIPFGLGGALHQYYHPNLPAGLAGGGGGTAVATMELSDGDGEGPSNRVFGNYEFVMFTREPLDPHAGGGPFVGARARIGAFLNALARYVTELQAVLNPGETMEFPADFDGEIGGRCLVLAAVPIPGRPRDLSRDPKPAKFGLMCPVVVTRGEMDWARKNGGGALLAMLDGAGHFPFSDPGRKAVAGGGLFGGRLK